MKSALAFSTVLALGTLGAFAPRPAHADPAADEERSVDVPTEIVVDLRDDATEADEREVEARLGGLALHPNSAYSASHERLYIATVDASEIPELMQRLAGDPNVEAAEPNQIYRALMVPNDPMWEQQWSFRMVDAPSAWDHADGSGVTVAVIDTGVAYEDFQSFKRVEDLAGTAFVPGYDFVSDDDHANDDHGHGTHVAGTIAQATNNGVGVAGLAPRAKIMPLKVLNKRGMGTAADIADAIRFAADEGANVINMSLGGGPRSAVMESAVAYARKKGVVVVCAAGNGGQGRVEYPAAYKGAFAVSAVGPDRELAFYSSWGKELAIAAPGGDMKKGGAEAGILQNTILPSRPDATNVYLAFQGTSMATPHVAGAAALIMSAGVTDATKVEAILRSTADKVGTSEWTERYGAGILNVGRAVARAQEMTGGRWHLLAGLGALAAFALRLRRGRIPFRLGLGGVLGAVMGASGFWFLAALGLPLRGVPGAGVLAEPMPLWDEAVLGASWHFTALWASALPVVLLVVAFLGVRRLRGLLAGLAVGWAAYFLVSAVAMPSDVQLIPGTAGALDRVWLAVNALLLFGLARLVALTSRRG